MCGGNLSPQEISLMTHIPNPTQSLGFIVPCSSHCFFKAEWKKFPSAFPEVIAVWYNHRGAHRHVGGETAVMPPLIPWIRRWDLVNWQWATMEIHRKKIP